VAICPVNTQHESYAHKVHHGRCSSYFDHHVQIAAKLRELRFDVEVDSDTATLGRKIRSATMKKVNYVVVVGDAVRSRIVAAEK
jgi:threonyl-tRNA synthetase